jgi:hypothetical protein
MKDEKGIMRSGSAASARFDFIFAAWRLCATSITYAKPQRRKDVEKKAEA